MRVHVKVFLPSSHTISPTRALSSDSFNPTGAVGLLLSVRDLHASTSNVRSQRTPVASIVPSTCICPWSDIGSQSHSANRFTECFVLTQHGQGFLTTSRNKPPSNVVFCNIYLGTTRGTEDSAISVACQSTSTSREKFLLVCQGLGIPCFEHYNT